VTNVEDVRRFADKLGAGDDVTLTVQRGKNNVEIKFKTAEGL